MHEFHTRPTFLLLLPPPCHSISTTFLSAVPPCLLSSRCFQAPPPALLCSHTHQLPLDTQPVLPEQDPEVLGERSHPWLNQLKVRGLLFLLPRLGSKSGGSNPTGHPVSEIQASASSPQHSSEAATPSTCGCCTPRSCGSCPHSNSS